MDRSQHADPRRLAQTHYENFPVGSRLLPRRQRRAVHAIYALARTADDLADEGGATPDVRLQALGELGSRLDAVAGGGAIDEPLFIELARAMREFGLPVEPFHQLLSAFRQDVVKTRYADLGELMDYCRRSANPVGRLLLRLFDADTETNRGRADAVCTGLQLTNLLQDLGEDYFRRHRLYLPQNELAAAGLAEGDIAERRMDARMQTFLRGQTARARRLLQLGAPLARDLPWRAGMELRLIVLGASRVLERLERDPAALYRGLRLGLGDRLLILVHALRHGITDGR